MCLTCALYVALGGLFELYANHEPVKESRIQMDTKMQVKNKESLLIAIISKKQTWAKHKTWFGLNQGSESKVGSQSSQGQNTAEC